MNFLRASIPLRLRGVNVYRSLVLWMHTKYSPIPAMPLAEADKSSFQTTHPEHEEAQWERRRILG
jgi:hypothetical protein